MTATDIKLEQLPASRLHAVLQFVNELPEFKETQLNSIADENEDPLLGFVGEGNQGSLAQNIDEDL